MVLRVRRLGSQPVPEQEREMRTSGNAKGRLSDTEVTAPGPSPANILPAPCRGGYAGKVYTSRPEVLFDYEEATG
jgi:hypothetical protein